ncbi:MAG TPA: sensor histidine kinase [Nitrospira sp.]|nr:sensor histidine kinase [Nitrospira sp.]
MALALNYEGRSVMQGAKWTVPVATVAMALGIFVVDYFAPLGYAVWLAYLLPLWFTPRAAYNHFPLVFAGACTGLIAADYVLALPGLDPKIATFNRGFGIVVIWVMALLLERSAKAERLQARLYQDLGLAQERLRQLSHRLLQAQETERRHVARDLHDEIGQALTALKLNLREAQSLSEPDQAMSMIVDSVQITDQLIQHIRNLALDLRPSLLDELGLVSAMQWYVNRQAERAGWTVYYAIQEFECRPSPEIEITCFRVLQEALTNTARHAKATHVGVTLSQREDSLELLVRDNGVGFDVEEGRARARSGNSIGLLGMEERVLLAGGSIEVQSQPHDGTTVLVRFPNVPASAESPSDQQEAS